MRRIIWPNFVKSSTIPYKLIYMQTYSKVCIQYFSELAIVFLSQSPSSVRCLENKKFKLKTKMSRTETTEINFTNWPQQIAEKLAICFPFSSHKLSLPPTHKSFVTKYILVASSRTTHAEQNIKITRKNSQSEWFFCRMSREMGLKGAASFYIQATHMAGLL